MTEVKWIKICTDIFDDEKMLLIDAMPDPDAIIVIWFKLLCLAGKQNNDGVFMMNDKIPYTDEMLANIFRRPLNTVRLALRTFEEFGMITLIEDTITIPNWEKHQNIGRMNELREKERRRKAAYRERKRLTGGAVSKQQQARQYAAEHPDATVAQIASALGISRNTVYKHIRGEEAAALPPAQSVQKMSRGHEQNEQKLNTQGEQAEQKLNTQMDVQLNRGLNTENHPETDVPAGKGCSENVPQDIPGTSLFSHALDVDEDIDIHLSSTAGTAGKQLPTLEQVTAFCRDAGLSIDPARFFEVNRKRGWVTKSGKPVDDWQLLARVWDKNERRPSAPSVQPEMPPSVEEVMRKYRCPREMAEKLIREDLW